MSFTTKAVANRFLHAVWREKTSVSQMKLQKLVYLAHGWHLGLYHKPLLNEPIEAWNFGPVVRSLYREFANFGQDAITRFATEFCDLGLIVPMLDDVFEDEGVEHVTKLIERIWEVYGEFTAIQLSNMTHEKGSPWDQCYKRNKGRRPVIIGDPIIQKYYENLADAA